MKSKISNAKQIFNIDWDRPQLVQLSTRPEIVVMTAPPESATLTSYKGIHFMGSVVSTHDESIHGIGHVSTMWRKDCFVPFTGSIKLSN